MTVGFSPGRLASRLVGRRPANVVLDGPAWNPGRLTTLRQRFLDELRTYQSSLIGGYPALTSEERGTVAVPRGQYCWRHDGIDDYASVTGIAQSTAVTLSAWINTNSVGSSLGGIICVNDIWLLRYLNATTFRWYPDVNTTIVDITIPDSLVGDWHHIALTQTGTTYAFYVDGVSVQTGTTVALTQASGETRVGAYTSTLWPFDGSIRDVRIYSVAKTAGEVLAIKNQELTPRTLDKTGCLLGDWCQEESGTTGYNWADPTKNLTLNNITQLTFHDVDAGVTFSGPNEFGHTLTGSVVIPRDESDTSKDVAGGSLEYAGPLKLPATTESPCFTGNGTNTYASMTTAIDQTNCTYSIWFNTTTTADNNILLSESAIADEYIQFMNPTQIIVATGGTGVTTLGFAVDEMAANTWYHLVVTKSGTNYRVYINGVESSSGFQVGGSRLKMDRIGGYVSASFTWSGGLADCRAFSVAKSGAEVLALTNGATDTTGLLAQWPMQEGPGDDETNRTMYDVSGNGNDLTIVNGTVANIWANVCPRVRDHQIQYGGRLDTNNVCIPALLDESEAADGNTLNLTAGKRGNRGTLIAPNIFGAPSLVRLGLTTETRYAFGDAVQTVDPDDTKFRRTAASGDDRYFVSDTALVGVNLIRAQNYTA